MKNFLLKRMVLAAVMIVAGVVGAYADNGDVFATKTKEGVMMTFTVISESSMTCCVGENDYSSNNNSCIDKSVTGTVTIPEKARGYTVVDVAEYAFQYCNIEEVVVPKSVSINHFGVFLYCENLKKFWFNDGINRVPKWFFYGCSSLEDVYIPSSVTTIWESAFQGCTSLRELQIPEFVTTIQDKAFKNMGECKFTFLPATPPLFGSGCFEGTPIEDYGEYGKLSSCSFFCRDDEAMHAYENELYNQSYLSDLILEVYPGINKLRDRESIGFMIDCTPNYTQGTLELWRFEEIPPADVTVLEIPDRVCGLDLDKIGNIFNYAGSSTIKKIVLPKTLRVIQLDAFRGFSALEDINFPEGLETVYTWAFAGCHSLQKIEFPSTLTGLERGAFRDCPNLSTVIMNARKVGLFSGEYAGNSDCEHCTMYVPFGTLKNFDTDAWHNEFMWRQQMDAKDGDIFPSAFKTGQDMWFQVLSAKDKTCRVYGDDDMKAIDQSYEGSVNIPQKPEGFAVTEIGDYAFHYCSKMTSMNIPNTVKYIGEGAFAVCTKLVSVNVPASVEKIGDLAFSWDVKLASVNLSEGLKEIGSGVFGICSELYSVTLPSTLRKLGDTAFAFCSNLTDINIPSGINTIGQSTFQSCTSLPSIDLPASVAFLGYNSFRNCYKLSNVIIRNSHVVLLDSDGKVTDDNGAFACDESRYAELHIPEGTLDYYDAAPWTTWFNAMICTMPYVATGIDGAVPSANDANPVWYSLDGKPMLSAPTKPGLYIKNGKKVMMK